jgi:dTDP-L-rhamnose 4-epimerase
MAKVVLITGGAGFIGSHLADELLAHGYRVRALDVLSPQVHGESRQRPAELDPRVELLVGDVTDPIAVREALEGVDAVFHFAAAVGVGQSMYQSVDYTRTNTLGTAVLMSALERRPIERLVVASSMSIYGEGRYIDEDGVVHDEVDREVDELAAGRWEPGELTPVPTPEEKPPRLTSVYALNKFDQERMGFILGRAYRIPTVALRFFNVYGPRQALSNPYTGVLAIFAARLLNARRPLVFEDGNQQRDFVHVRDVTQACRLALESDRAPGRAYNVGSGRPITVREIGERMARVMGREELTPELTGRYRMGDIRHCFADITRAKDELGYAPRVSLEDGMRELAGWLRGRVADDRAEQAQEELSRRGLTL